MKPDIRIMKMRPMMASRCQPTQAWIDVTLNVKNDRLRREESST